MRAHRLSALALVAVLSGLAIAGCSADATPAPTDTPTPEPTASPTATAAPTVSAAPSATFTPWPTVSATPIPTPAPSGTPTPVPSVSATPTSPAQFCIGTAANREFLLAAARGMKTTIYCATGLPAGWVIASGDWSGATVTLTYKYRNTSQKFTLKQGAFCTSSPATCIGGSYPPAGSGTTAFDGMTGQFLQSGTSAYVIAVNPGTKNAYMITSTGVSQSAIATFSANMKAVPKT